MSRYGELKKSRSKGEMSEKEHAVYVYCLCSLSKSKHERRELFESYLERNGLTKEDILRGFCELYKEDPPFYSLSIKGLLDGMIRELRKSCYGELKKDPYSSYLAQRTHS